MEREEVGSKKTSQDITATVVVRGGPGQSHGYSRKAQEGLSEDLAVALPLGHQGSPVLPLEVSFVKRARSSLGTEPSTMSSNASRPRASPLHIPDPAGEALSAQSSWKAVGWQRAQRGPQGASPAALLAYRVEALPAPWP